MFLTWVLGGYAWIFVHRPFEVWPRLGGYHIERLYMIAALGCWLVCSKKHIIRNGMVIAFGSFWFVVFLSWIFSPYRQEGSVAVEGYFKQVVFFLLVISSIRGERFLRQLVLLFFFAMSAYIVHSFREFLAGRHTYAMATVRMIGVDFTYSDPNTFAATIIYSLPLVWPLWHSFRRIWQRAGLAAYVILSSICIILTGSRSGFVAFIVLCVVVALLSRHRFPLLILIALGALVIWTNLRLDLRDRFHTLIDSSSGPAGAQMSAEGRIAGFLDGVQLWKTKPLLGTGPGCFGIATGKGYEAHNLYGQVLGELGSLGALTLVLIVGFFIKNTLEARRITTGSLEQRKSFSYQLSMSISLALFLLMLLGLAGHNLYRYTWLWYAAYQMVALDHLRLITTSPADTADVS